MSYKTHMNFGILFGLLFIIYCYHNNPNIIIFLIICSISALIPDIDHPKSYITNKVTKVKNKYARQIILLMYVLLLAYLIYQYKLYILISTLVWLILALTLKHRHFTHSMIGMIVFIVPFITTIYFAPVLLGYFSHIFSDMLTNRGVFLFYPLKTKIKIGNVTTGGNSENIVYIIVIIVNMILIYKLLS